MKASAISGPSPDDLEAFLKRLGLRLPLRSAVRPKTGSAGFPLPAGGRPAMLKWYGSEARAPARLRTERAFSELLWGLGCRQIPEPLGWDLRLRVGVFAWSGGRALKPSDIDLKRCAEALAFLLAMNRARPLAAGRGFPPAQGACFGIGSRLDAVTRQIARLTRAASHPAAAGFIAEELEPAWQVITDVTAQRGARAALRFDVILPLSERCLAPADFGFQQATVAPDGQLVFTDLAGAGWEDPAWVAAAFFAQIKLPPPLDYWDTFVRNLARGLGQGPELARRAAILLPVSRFLHYCRAGAGVLADKNIPATRLKALRKGLREIAETKWWR